MSEDFIAPRKPSRVRLRSIDHTVRNLAQPMQDVAELVVNLQGIPHQVAKLAKAQEQLSSVVSSERRAYAAAHATDLAKIESLTEVTRALKDQNEKHKEATDKLTASVNRAAGALAAIGSVIALLKFLADHHH